MPTMPADTLTTLRHAAMKRLRMQPNTRSYNALLSACERAGQADRALEVFGNMRRAAARSSGRLDLQPTEVTYNTLLSACAKAGRWADVAGRACCTAGLFDFGPK